MTEFEERDIVYSDGGEEPKTIHYIATGARDGPLLIFLHGFPAIARTWLPQLKAFSSLGFRVVAPDMPGYGKSSTSKDILSYSHKRLNAGLLALLGDTGRDAAVWAGHDWGAALLSSFATHYPERCKAIALLSIPYRSVELGLDHLLTTVDRDVYPADEYPYGQWDYMRFYEESFEKAVGNFELEIPGLARLLFSRVPPLPSDKPAPFATARQRGAFFAPSGAPKPEEIPFELMIDQKTYDEFVAGMQRTGFGPACTWYMNHKENHAYNRDVPNDGALDIPVLYISSTHDVACLPQSRLGDEMRRVCKNLTEITLDAAHWIQIEKQEETNAALARFLVEKLPSEWPVSWNDHKVSGTS